MRRQLTPAEALDRLQQLCGRSEQCSADIRRKLAAWGIDASQAADILQSLAAERYVDDARFARAFVRDRSRFDRWGRRKIRQALIIKRIHPDVLVQALDTIDEADYTEGLQRLVKARLAREEPGHQGRDRVLRAMLARGFEATLVIDALNAASP